MSLKGRVCACGEAHEQGLTPATGKLEAAGSRFHPPTAPMTSRVLQVLLPQAWLLSALPPIQMASHAFPSSQTPGPASLLPLRIIQHLPSPSRVLEVQLGAWYARLTPRQASLAGFSLRPGSPRAGRTPTLTGPALP